MLSKLLRTTRDLAKTVFYTNFLWIFFYTLVQFPLIYYNTKNTQKVNVIATKTTYTQPINTAEPRIYILANKKPPTRNLCSEDTPKSELFTDK